MEVFLNIPVKYEKECCTNFFYIPRKIFVAAYLTVNQLITKKNLKQTINSYTKHLIELFVMGIVITHKK